MKTIFRFIFLFVALLLMLSSSNYAVASVPLPEDDFKFEDWPNLPEYTVLNPFPYKGTNCTWFAHGRMMQLGYCKYALDSMWYHAYDWAYSAGRGAEVSQVPTAGSIAYWDKYVFYNSRLGHVGVVEMVMEDGAIVFSDSSSSGNAYNLRMSYPGDKLWPTAFIIVPKSRDWSKVFTPGQKVRTTADSLNFRLEGVDESPVLLEKGTVAEIKAHVSNGIYGNQPGNRTYYFYWWYAAVELDDEIKHGWMAEAYLEAIDGGNPAPEPEADPDPDGETDSEPDPELEPDPEPEPEPELEADPIPNFKPGDVSNNGEVNVQDVALTMQFILKGKPLSDIQLLAADVNNDQVINVRDVVLIMQYALKLIDSFDF